MQDAESTTHEADGHARRRARATGAIRSFGQALSASLDSKTTGLPRRTATQENGDCTGQPGAPAVGLVAARSRCARLESENSSSIGGLGEISVIARSTTS